MFQLLRDQTRGLVNRLFFNHFSSYCEEIKSVKFWISKWKTSHGINQGELFPTVYMYTKHRGGVRVLESVASHKYLFLGKHEEVFCNTVETMCPLFPLVFFVSTSEACYTAQCLTKSPLERRTRLALCAIGPATQHMRQQWIFSILHRLELVGLRRLLDSKHSFYTIEDLLLGWLNRSNKSFRRNSVFLIYIFGFWYIVKQKNRNFQSSKKSFYPMILWEKTLLLTNEQLQRVKTLKERTQWSCKQIPDLLRICLETNFWTFEGNICTKPDGNLIG